MPEYVINQETAQPISRLSSAGRPADGDLYVLTKGARNQISSYSAGFADVAERSVRDISAMFDFGSMAYRDSSDFAKSDHQHRYAHVDCYPVYGPGEGRECVMTVGISDDYGSKQLSVYAPPSVRLSVPEPDIGELRFLANGRISAEIAREEHSETVTEPGVYEPGVAFGRWMSDEDEDVGGKTVRMVYFGVNAYEFGGFRCDAISSEDGGGLSADQFCHVMLQKPGFTCGIRSSVCCFVDLSVDGTAYRILPGGPAVTVPVQQDGYYPARFGLSAAYGQPAELAIGMNGYSDDVFRLYTEVKAPSSVTVVTYGSMYNKTIGDAIDGGSFDGWVYPDGSEYRQKQGKYDFSEAYRAFGGQDGRFRVPLLSDFVWMNPGVYTEDATRRMPAQVGIARHTHRFKAGEELSRSISAEGKIHMNQYQKTSSNSAGVHSADSPRNKVKYIKCDDIRCDVVFDGETAIYEDSVPGDYTYPGYILTPVQIYIGRKLRT